MGDSMFYPQFNSLLASAQKARDDGNFQGAIELLKEAQTLLAGELYIDGVITSKIGFIP